MKSQKNLIQDKGVATVNIGYSKMSEEGVFKTSRGKFIVKVKVGFKIQLVDTCDTKKQAIASYNQFKAS